MLIKQPISVVPLDMDYDDTIVFSVKLKAHKAVTLEKFWVTVQEGLEVEEIIETSVNVQRDVEE